MSLSIPYNITDTSTLDKENHGRITGLQGAALRIELSGGFLILCSLVGFFLGLPRLGSLLLAVAVHECGHLLVLLAQGRLPTSLRLDAGGLCIRYSGGLGGYVGDALRALGGPAAGCLLGLGLLGETKLLQETAQMSLGLSLLNLLPASPLDGGCLVKSLLSCCLPPTAVARCTLLLDVACVLFLGLLALRTQPRMAVFALWLGLRMRRRD